MEDLQHFSSLRKKLSKELHQPSFENQGESRPQTATKQVSFDFSDQMDMRELRNLREKHAIELERLSTPSQYEEPEKKKKKKDKKKKSRRKSKKKVEVFEVFLKPAMDLEYFEAYEGSLASSRSSLKEVKKKRPANNYSSHHSLYSEGSVCSKKSLVEEIEDAYKEARQALENSFKIDSKANDGASQKSNSSVNFSRENFEHFEKLSAQSKAFSNEVGVNEKNEDFKKYVKGKTIGYYHQELEKASEHSEKSEGEKKKRHKKKKKSHKEKDEAKEIEIQDLEEKKSVNLENNSGKHSRASKHSDHIKNSALIEDNSLASQVFNKSDHSQEHSRVLSKGSEIVHNSSKHSSHPSHPTPKSNENLPHSKNSSQNLSHHNLETPLHVKTSSIPDPDSLDKFTSHKSNAKIFSKLIEKPLESALHDDQSIHSDIVEEEKKLNEESLKSSVDFTISDQTAFESQKFSQDPNFVGSTENLKKGIFNRLLSPIIQNLALENSSDLEKSLENRKKEGLDDASFCSHQSAFGLSSKILDVRTSKSQPLENFRYEESVIEHNESLILTSDKPQLLESIDFNELSIINKPEQFINPELIRQEKIFSMFKLIEKSALFLMADNVFYSYNMIKARNNYLKEKIEKIKLAEANFEYNVLRKVVDCWKAEVKHSKFCNSRRFIQYVERWNFVKLFHSFEGLKFVCRAHKQWIFEVRNKLKEHQIAGIFKNWVLYIRYRKAKQAIQFRKMKKLLGNWNKLLAYKAEMNRKACIHWYLRKNFKVFRVWNEFCLRKKERWVKRVKADKKYYEKIYAKTFLSWKHWKALEQANFIPLRICTKTVLVKKNGNIQEKSLLDIKIIKN